MKLIEKVARQLHPDNSKGQQGRSVGLGKGRSPQRRAGQHPEPGEA